jgi:hypothetical protein
MAPVMAPKKRRKWPWIVGGLILLVIIISIASNAGKKADNASNPAAPVTNALATDHTTSNAAPTTAASKPLKLLDVTGNGIKQTASFTAGSEWTISYRYDCTAFGQSGNFAVTIMDTSGGLVNVAANELGTKGTAASVQHESGRFYLEVNSECSWHIVVTG